MFLSRMFIVSAFLKFLVARERRGSPDYFNFRIRLLNEFTLAYHKGKIIGILEGSGGIANMIQEIATVCAKNNTESNETENIIYSESPDEIVSLVLERLKHGKG